MVRASVAIPRSWTTLSFMKSSAHVHWLVPFTVQNSVMLLIEIMTPFSSSSLKTTVQWWSLEFLNFLKLLLLSITGLRLFSCHMELCQHREGLDNNHV